jgi:protein ImuB
LRIAPPVAFNRQSAISNQQSAIPLVLLHAVGQRQLVVVASPEARQHGIRAGMTLAQARALWAGVEPAQHDPAADRRALVALGRWMMRFTPVVAVGEDFNTEKTEGTERKKKSTYGGTGVRGYGGKRASGHSPPHPHTPTHPHCLFLDVTGCERLFGGLDRLRHRVERSLAQLRITANVAIGPTSGAAWAAAYCGTEILDSPSQIQNPKSKIQNSQSPIRNLLAPLPLESLRLDPSTVNCLHHLGLETVGDLLKLPRDQLPARFGPGLLLRLDQAMGDVPEPLVPILWERPLRESMEFEFVVPSIEAIHIVFGELMGRLIVQLERRGCGARRVEVELACNFGPPIRRTILLSRPSRDRANLLNLFRCSMDDAEINSSRPYFSSDGFTALRLFIPVFEKMSPEQIRLLEGEDYAQKVELDHLVERLRARMGNDTVMQATLIASHAPERAYALGNGLGGNQSAIRSLQSTIQNVPRPLVLLATPVELRVMVLPLHDEAGRPVAFTHDHRTRRVVYFVGPERIAGQWWDGHNKTRDYFDVEDPDGRRWWIFRVLESGRWFLHGMFN